MIAGAHLRVDPEARTHHALAGTCEPRPLGSQSALTRELTLAVRNDDLETLLPRPHGLTQGPDHGVDAVAAHPLNPAYTHAFERRLDIEALAATVLFCLARE